MTDRNTLHLGITMAGAVSAGAYTAGVMDYLLEVLDEWEKYKNQNDERVPTHNIKIDVLSGASAGGMTAAITSLVLHQQKKNPICAFSDDIPNAYGDCVNPVELDSRKKSNRLYNAWVNLTSPDMVAEMLKTDDETKILAREKDGAFKPGGANSCISALNSNFIKKLAKQTLSFKSSEQLTLSPYVSENLRLFVTLTNIDGFEIGIGFAGEGDVFKPNFLMYDHRDAAFFRFTPLDEEDPDGSIFVDFKTGLNSDLFIDAGMATGAFPIGLSYRTFTRPLNNIKNDFLLKKFHGNIKLEEFEIAGKYPATFIDGGTINNEPFEFTDLLLQKLNPNTVMVADHNVLNSLTLMIDPFPSEARQSTQYGDDPQFQPYSLSAMIGKLLSTLRTQVLVKPGFIERALAAHDYSWFIMAPRRKVYKDERDEGEAIDGSKAIACGSLGGFGGFLDVDFREHDFYLGRINCKSFLQKHFCVPAGTGNNIFTNGYSEKARQTFGIRDKAGVIQSLPIIPDVNILRAGDPDVKVLYRNLVFPYRRDKDFKKKFYAYKSAVLERIKFVVERNTGISGFILRTGLWWYGGTIFEKIYDYILADLRKWKLVRD